MNPLPLHSRLLTALLILCAVAAYAPAIGAGYIWDDDTLLTANPQMHSAHGFAEIWQGRNSRDYTPLTLTSFWMEYRVWGDNPTGYHVVNILLHAFAAVMIWRILCMLGVPGAWLAALLFAIHPVNVASVAWVAERKNTLSAALFFASALAFLRARKGGSSWGFYIASVALFVFAGLSKGAVVTLPVVLAGCILWMDRKITRRDLLQLFPFVVVALAVAWLTVHYQSRAMDYGLVPAGMAYRLSRAGFAVWFYLNRIFSPDGLSPMARPWLPDLHSISAWWPLIAVVSAGALFFWNRKSWGRALLFAYGYFLLMLLPALGFVWMVLMQETPAADWWQYMATPGIFACAGAGFAMALNKRESQTDRRVLQAMASVGIAALCFLTWQRCAIYKSMETYCRAVVAEDPHAWSMQNNLGVVLKQRGEFLEAIPHYRQALSDNPRFMEAHNNLGNALALSGDFQGAETQYRISLQLLPGVSEILASLADVCFQQGKVHDAFAAQADAIKADRMNPERYNQFGLLLMKNGRFYQAATCYKQALALSPGDIVTQINLIHALLSAGKREEAIAAGEQTLESARKTGDEKLIHIVASLLEECRR